MWASPLPIFKGKWPEGPPYFNSWYDLKMVVMSMQFCLPRGCHKKTTFFFCWCQIISQDFWGMVDPRAVASLTVPGGHEFHFPHLLINFTYLSSNFSHFLPHFGPPGGRVAHPGRPWLRHWWIPQNRPIGAEGRPHTNTHFLPGKMWIFWLLWGCALHLVLPVLQIPHRIGLLWNHPPGVKNLLGK